MDKNKEINTHDNSLAEEENNLDTNDTNTESIDNNQPDSEVKYNELNNKYIRLFAEFENFKKRSVRERLELISIANQDTIIPLLSILDDFDRALASINNDIKNLEHQHSGFLLIHQKLKKILEQKGLKEMETNKLDEFNSELHEAIAHVDSTDNNSKNKIIDVIEKGYYLNAKLIRHAKVVVGK